MLLNSEGSLILKSKEQTRIKILKKDILNSALWQNNHFNAFLDIDSSNINKLRSRLLKRK